MKLLLVTAFALGMSLGCDSVAPPKDTATASKAPIVESAPAPTAEPPAPSKPIQTATHEEAKNNDNPHRLFQLRTLEKTVVVAHRKKLECWVMDTESKQQEGMMWLTDKDVRDEQGMIFVFADAQQQSFWMQNTLIPLDIIYMDEGGKVLNVAHGKVKDETSLPSEGPAKYVLELKHGMAARLGIGAGTRLEISSSLRFKPDES